MSDSSEVVERIRFPELAAALQKDETLSNEARVKLVNLMNVYSPAHDVSYLKTVQTFVGKSLMARAVEQLIKDLRVKEQPKEDIAFDDSDDEEPEPPPKKPKKQKLDHMELYGSHELVLTHHMQLPAGFTIETDEEQSLQFIVPNRQKPNELKSFRARLAKHLRAIGFVCLEDDVKKDMTQCKLPGIHVPERLTHAWARETVDADGKDVSLDPHTLKVKFTGPDPALQLDPLEYL